MNIPQNSINNIAQGPSVPEYLTIGGREFSLLLSPIQIAERVTGLARQIHNDLDTLKELMVLVLMNGAFIFASDLCRQIPVPLSMEFLRIKSYQGTRSAGVVSQMAVNLDTIRNRPVLLLEDIADTGNTLIAAIDRILKEQPASLQIATLLYKPTVFNKKIPIDYIGFEIPDTFVVGYGLDIDGEGRNLAGIYSLIT